MHTRPDVSATPLPIEESATKETPSNTPPTSHSTEEKETLKPISFLEKAQLAFQKEKLTQTTTQEDVVIASSAGVVGVEENALLKSEAASEAAVENAIKGGEGVVAKSVVRAAVGAAATTAATHSLDVKNTRMVLKDAVKTDPSQLSFYDKYFVGFKQNLVANTGKCAVLFGSMSYMQHTLPQYLRPDQRELVDFLSFVGSNIIVGLGWTPFSLANMRMRVDNNLKGYWQALTATSAKDTIKALIRGTFVGSPRDILFAGLFFGSFQQSKQLIVNEEDSHVVKMMKTACLGAVTGSAAGLTSYPLDVLQKRAMSQPNRSMRDIWKEMKSRGFSGFLPDWKRVPMRMGAYSVAIGVTFEGVELLFEQAKKHPSLLSKMSLFKPSVDGTSSEMPDDFYRDHDPAGLRP